jgi:hypothetical protein
MAMLLAFTPMAIYPGSAVPLIKLCGTLFSYIYVCLLISSTWKQNKTIAMWITSMFLTALKLIFPPAFTFIAHEARN